MSSRHQQYNIRYRRFNCSMIFCFRLNDNDGGFITGISPHLYKYSFRVTKMAILTIVNFQVGRAGGSLPALGSDPAGVLARVGGGAVGQLQGEEGILAGDLDSVSQLVIQGLVVLEPCGGHSGSSASSGLKHCLFSSCKEGEVSTFQFSMTGYE